MTARVILVRHAETVANAARLWQGATNAPFSPRGREQLSRLRLRLGAAPPDLAVSSDLGRAEATAGALGLDFEADPRWREPNVGAWEGLTFEEIRDRHPEALQALLDGEDVSLGGGERLSDVSARLGEAFDDVVARLEGSGTAIVVSHGVALLTLVSRVLHTRRPAPLRLMRNTALTTFEVTERGVQLVSYNDTVHLDPDPGPRPGETSLFLIRHGETAANVEQRWQGHGDWRLTDLGIRQAGRLSFALPGLDALYSSPLRRALDTAAAVAEVQGLGVKLDDDLKEIGFGAWENLTADEIALADPVGWDRFTLGEDIVRGGSGETFMAVRARMTRAIEEIVSSHLGGVVGVVTHGGASRAFLTGVLGMDFSARARIHSLHNTAYGRLEFGDRGPLLAAWNLAPHLVEPD